MGCECPVGEPPLTLSITPLTTTTSLRPGRLREEWSEGSRRQNCEPRNTNAIAGRHPGGESAAHDKAAWFEGHGKWRGCAMTVHALIWGALSEWRPERATGVGLRPGSKDPEPPPSPTARLAARAGVTRCVIGQKSAAAIVGDSAWNGAAPKGRTRRDRVESGGTR